MKEINEAIKNGNFKTVYLLSGEEVYMVKKYFDAIRAALVDPSTEMLNYSYFNGKTDIDNIITACDTLPFMSEKRLVAVKDSKLFEPGRKDDSEKLKDYIPNIPQSTVLCFVEDKADKRSGLYKAVKKYGCCAEFDFLKDRDLIGWVCNEGKGRIKSDMAEYLIKCVGTAMESLEGEIDKLINYVPQGELVTREIIDSICTRSPETNIFDMVEAIGKKQPAKALEIYNNMLRMKQSPFYVLKMTARQFKLILECKYLAGKGMGENEIAERLSLRNFVVRGCLAQARNFKTPVLVEALKDCAKCDVDFKRGKISDRLGVEVIILKYSKSNMENQ